MIRSPYQEINITCEIQHVRPSPFIYTFPEVSAQYDYHFSSTCLNLLIINNGEKIPPPYPYLVISCPGDNQHWWDAFQGYLCRKPLDGEREKWNREGEWRRKEITHWTPAAIWQDRHPNWVPQRKREPYQISDLALWCVWKEVATRKCAWGQRESSNIDPWRMYLLKNYPDGFSACPRLNPWPPGPKQQRTPPESYLCPGDLHMHVLGLTYPSQLILSGFASSMSFLSLLPVLLDLNSSYFPFFLSLPFSHFLSNLL